MDDDTGLSLRSPVISADSEHKKTLIRTDIDLRVNAVVVDL
jgi:hypothetical protein